VSAATELTESYENVHNGSAHSLNVVIAFNEFNYSEQARMHVHRYVVQ